MSVQCVSCRQEAFPDGDNRLPPWCPSCGGSLKPSQGPVPALIAAGTLVSSWTAVGEPERMVTAEPPPVSAEAGCQRPEPPLRLDELGEPERVFHASTWRRLVCWICCLACFGLAGAIGYGVLHQPHKKPHAGLALMGLAAVGGFASLYLALTLGEVSYLVFRDALVRRRGKESQVVPWDQIRQVNQTVHPAWKKYQIVSRKGFDLELTGNTANYLALGDLIEERVVAHLLPAALADLEAGRSVRFGPLGASRGGLHFDGLSCPWSQVTLSTGLNMEPMSGQVYSNMIHLHVHSPVRTKAYKVEIGKITNFRLFLELVRQVAPHCLPPGM